MAGNNPPPLTKSGAESIGAESIGAVSFGATFDSDKTFPSWLAERTAKAVQLNVLKITVPATGNNTSIFHRRSDLEPKTPALILGATGIAGVDFNMQ